MLSPLGVTIAKATHNALSVCFLSRRFSHAQLQVKLHVAHTHTPNTPLKHEPNLREDRDGINVEN